MIKSYIIFIILFFISLSSNAQIVNIPDPILKSRLLATNTTTALNAKDLTGNWLKIDNNNDGEIQVTEALNVGFFRSSNTVGVISSYVGLNQFVNLQELVLANNRGPASLNLSGLVNLKNLNCYYNSLISVDLTGCISLENLSLHMNYLSILNVNGLPSLKFLQCENNNLSTLEVNNCLLLNHLQCYNNPNLSWLNINNGFNWIPNTNYFGDGLRATINQLCTSTSSVLDLKNYYNTLGYSPSNFVSNCTTLGTNEDEFQNSKITFYPNPTKEKIIFIKEVNDVSVYNSNGTLVQQCAHSIKELDLSNFTSGLYILKIKTENGVEIAKIIKK